MAMSDDQDPDVLGAALRETLAAAHSPGPSQAAAQTPFQAFKTAFARTFGIFLGTASGLLTLALVLWLLAETLGLSGLLMGRM